MTKAKHLTVTEYAKRRGVSRTAVYKAIKAEKIVKGHYKGDDGYPRIIPEIADQEWSNNYNPAYDRVTKTGGTPVSVKDRAEATEKGEATLAAAKKAKAVYDAKLAELEYKKKAGILVEKDQVYKALFAFGQELRNNLLNIPDRIMPDIRAAVTDSEAHAMLYEAIAKELEKLAEMAQRPLTSDR